MTVRFDFFINIEKDTEEDISDFLGVFRLCNALKVVFQCCFQIAFLCGVSLYFACLLFEFD